MSVMYRATQRSPPRTRGTSCGPTPSAPTRPDPDAGRRGGRTAEAHAATPHDERREQRSDQRARRAADPTVGVAAAPSSSATAPFARASAAPDTARQVRGARPQALVAEGDQIVVAPLRALRGVAATSAIAFGQGRAAGAPRLRSVAGSRRRRCRRRCPRRRRRRRRLGLPPRETVQARFQLRQIALPLLEREPFVGARDGAPCGGGGGGAVEGEERGREEREK